MEQLTAICINDKTTRDKKVKVLGITEGKEYPVKLCRYPNYYEIINDLGEEDCFYKTRFKIIDKLPIERLFEGVTESINKMLEGEKVENILIMECIDNESQEKFLTLKKRYEILEENDRGYFIMDDTKTKYLAHKSRFKPVEPQKEVEEEKGHVKGKEIICYNKECESNKDNKCTDKMMNVGSSLVGCPIKIKEPINYEEEYNKLKKENEETKERNHTQSESIKEMLKEIEELKEFKIKYKRMENQFNNNNKVLEDYSVKITILEADNKEYKRANEGLAAESKERLQTIKKLTRQIEENTENAILRNKVEDLGKQIEELQKVNKEINDHNSYLKKEVEEGNEVLENEYHNKIFLAEQEINRLNTEVACLKAFKEKDNKQIQNLKDAVKKLAEVL